MSLTEQEVAAAVVAGLRSDGWDVYQEVSTGYAGARADIVASRGPVLWVVEAKRSLSWTVFEQAYRWPAHFRSVAVSQPHRRRSVAALHRVCSCLGLGVIEAWSACGQGQMRELIRAPFQRPKRDAAQRLQNCLHPAQQVMCEAGSNGGGYFTPYRETMLRVRRFVRQNEGCTIGDLMAHIESDHHYASDRGAKSSIRTMLCSSAEPWCGVDYDAKPYRFRDAKPEEALPRWIA